MDNSLIMPMRLERFVPPVGHPLQPYLSSIFRFRTSGDVRREVIVPKGIVDILFNFSDPLLLDGARLGKNSIASASVHAAGLQTRAIVSTPQGSVDLLGVSLRLETCAALLPLPLFEITDRTVEGELIFRELQELCHRLQDLPCFADQCDLIVDWLLPKLSVHSAHAAVREACRSLRQSHGEQPVLRTARTLSVSARHLRRLFAQHVGVSPADYIRLVRFVDAIHGLSAQERSLTAVAHAAGYYDQAHFCREFREFVGMTPLEYRHQSGPPVGHIFSA